MGKKISILMIDDSKDDAILLLRHLRHSEYDVMMETVDQLQAFHTQLRSRTWDIILCDMKMPTLDVSQILEILKDKELDIPLLVVSGQIETVDAVDLMYAGAKDFIRKDDLARLIPSIERAITDQQLRKDKKKAVMALQVAKEEAEMANRAKSYFLMVMNHELRTPLHAIEGMLDILTEDCTNWSEEQRFFLHAASKSAKTLGKLINDILDLNAAESGCLQLEHSRFDLVACLVGALEPFLLTMNEKGLKFVFEMKNLPHLVVADEVRLRQVVLNLVANSLKFTDKGEISIVTEMKMNEFGNEMLHFIIIDTGYGIAEDKIGEVFQPFVQFSTPGKEQQVGTGLGTSIVKQFIDIMNGDIRVESTLGEGSCFSFEIPLEVYPESDMQLQDRINFSYKSGDKHSDLHQFYHANTDMKTRQKMHTPIGKIRLRVLLVEDDPINQIIAQRRLVHAGIQVDVANDGNEAWEKLRQEDNHYDVLLTDLRMPGMDGISLTKKVRSYEHQEHLKPLTIIGLTAHALMEVKEECLDIGMDDFLTKPIEAEAILNVVTSYAGELS